MLEMTADNPPSAEPATVDQPPVETTHTGAEATPQIEGEALATGEETELDEIEEELEGVKLRGKKEALERIKAERLMQQDYTKKTMSLAEERRAAQAEREQFTQVRELHTKMDQELFQLRSVDARLNQLRGVNFAALSQQNPEYAQQLRDELIQLQAYRPQLEGSITQKQQQLHLNEQRETAKLFSEAQAFLMREIKGWSPAKDAELETYAKSHGVNTGELGKFLLRNPQIAVLIDKAQKWDKSIKERMTTIKQQAAAPKPPSRVEGGKASTQKSLSDMSPAEYREYRQKQRR